MLAMNYRGPYRVRAVTNKPIPEIEHPNDAIVRVTRSCKCGSDLHLYHGLVPDTRVGMTFGHEFVGIVGAHRSAEDHRAGVTVQRLGQGVAQGRPADVEVEAAGDEDLADSAGARRFLMQDRQYPGPCGRFSPSRLHFPFRRYQDDAVRPRAGA